ncbi:hypothetical protein ColTof3_04228 [Colletotrichum tofieldiae]|nr:hypothetical protein ColTof3_04228 [Colletotrichum tofieldiae]GKT87180.1 hypothetical protein Ct61P_05030 [Colletotrichum tofieldiae]
MERDRREVEHNRNFGNLLTSLAQQAEPVLTSFGFSERLEIVEDKWQRPGQCNATECLECQLFEN